MVGISSSISPDEEDDEEIDPDVRELGDYFNIEERWVARHGWKKSPSKPWLMISWGIILPFIYWGSNNPRTGNPKKTKQYFGMIYGFWTLLINMCNIVLQLADIDTRTSWRCSVQEIIAQVLPQSTGASYGIRRDAVFFIFVWCIFGLWLSKLKLISR